MSVKKRYQDLPAARTKHFAPEAKKSFSINVIPEGDKARSNRAVNHRKVTVTIARGKPFLS